MRSQGFWKRRSAVSMPRPKKEIVLPKEESGLPIAVAISATTANEEVLEPAPQEQEQHRGDGSFET